jgi:hypothetical protein
MGIGQNPVCHFGLCWRTFRREMCWELFLVKLVQQVLQIYSRGAAGFD